MLRYEDIIVPTVGYIRRKYGYHFDLSITTNATLIDESKAQFLHENNVGFLVSADGGRETQNINRPTTESRTSFDKMAEGAKHILKMRPNTQVRMTLTPERGGFLFDDLKSVHKIGFRQMAVFPDTGGNWSMGSYE